MDMPSAVNHADEYRNQEQAFLICYAIAQKEGIRITEEEFDYFVAGLKRQ